VNRWPNLIYIQPSSQERISLIAHVVCFNNFTFIILVSQFSLILLHLFKKRNSQSQMTFLSPTTPSTCVKTLKGTPSTNYDPTSGMAGLILSPSTTGLIMEGPWCLFNAGQIVQAAYPSCCSTNSVKALWLTVHVVQYAKNTKCTLTMQQSDVIPIDNAENILYCELKKPQLQ